MGNRGVTVEDASTVPDISRRELMRRGAALGAAVAVASPVVQGLGRMSAFAQVSPPPGEEGPDLPSHIQLLVTFGDNSAVYGVKWDGGWGGLAQQGNVCWSPTGDPSFQAAGSEQLAAFSGASVTATSRGYEVSLPASVSVVDAASFDAGSCFPMSDSQGPYQDGGLLVFPKPTGG